MIKKLRRKFVLVSITIVFAVLFILAVTINIANYININEHSNKILSLLLENEGNFSGMGESRDDIRRSDRSKGDALVLRKLSPETPFSTRFFTAKIDNDEIFVADIERITLLPNEALNYAITADLEGKTKGLIDTYKYQSAQKDYGTLIVFVDVSRELETIQFFITNTILVFVIVLITVFVLLMIFSKVAIKPIVESYEKQKQFITDASHELKTPLTIINTNIDVLEMYFKENEWTRSIQNQTIRLSQLVTSLVELTRMDEGNLQLQIVDFSLSDALTESAQAFFALATAQNKKITLDVHKNISYCGNEETIRQLVCILLDNGIKYSSENSEIKLSLAKQGKKRFLTVSNETAHLTKGNLEVLFERFYRADASRNSQTGGYGIGLSIAKAIVSQHKGKIAAQSSDGKSFVISIQL